jgi:hypothetical protein
MSKLKEDVDFGKYFAGERRNLPSREAPEPDTSEEKGLIGDLKSHVNIRLTV